MSQKIQVLALTGFLGAGKTTLLNRLLMSSRQCADSTASETGIDPERTVVLVNEVGDIGIDHHLIRHIDDHIAVIPSGCICCSVKGELVNALRDLFMAAVQRRIKPFSHVVIETTGIADPSSLRYTLAFDRFLADRYRYAGCVTVVDVPHIQAQYARHPEVQSQLAMADGLVLTKVDLATPEQVVQVDGWLSSMFPQARSSLSSEVVCLRDLFVLGALSGSKPRLFGATGRATSALVAPGHGQLDVSSDQWSGRVSQSVLVKALAATIEQADDTLLRFKGLFMLDTGECLVMHAVHGTAYPPEMVDPVIDEVLPDCTAVVITRGSSASGFIVSLRQRLSAE